MVIDTQLKMTRCQALAWVMTVLAVAATGVDLIWGIGGHSVGRLGIVLAIFAATMHVRAWLVAAIEEQRNAFTLGRDYGRGEQVRSIR